ncbi:hypothetical protein LA080_010028 [Diaporthe eres]|nr:hypothetical protein LA080_010028 [Diaporthe eres]
MERNVPRGQPKTRRTRQTSGQIIDSRLIDPQKLHDKLVHRFGLGNYQIEMRHNKFILLARAHLTPNEILECRYW